jgi:SAM-dependent methyltransferase
VHALPFRDESVDYVLSLAVLEHLRNPFTAGQEMFRVLRRGGYVYCDTNFVFCYHGYPHHYFNSSLHGIKQVFGQFTELRTGVPPYQMPSYALENYVSTYLQHFKPAAATDVEFVRAMQNVLRYPIRQYDARFPQEIAYRFSAGVFYLGYKCLEETDSVIPEPIQEAYRRAEALQARFPNPNDLTRLDNLMTWARREGRQRDAAIAASLDTFTFSKYWDERPLDRAWMESLPLEEPEPASEISFASVQPQSTSWWTLPLKAGHVFVNQGPRALAQQMKEYLRWLALRS